MAVYCSVCGFGHLRADRPGPGSALEPYAGVQYGTTFPFYPLAVYEPMSTMGSSRWRIIREEAIALEQRACMTISQINT